METKMQDQFSIEDKSNQAIEEYLWNALAGEGQVKIIDLLVDVSSGKYQGKTIRWSKPFSSNEVVHRTVCAYLRRKGVGVEKKEE